MSTRRTMPGGWVSREKLSVEKPGAENASRAAQKACRWCGSAVPRCRFTFCSPACVHQWRMRTDPGYLREQVFARDGGVCALCGLDTEALRKDKRKLDFTARRSFEKEWGRRRYLWDADHIIPVAEGGGECDLSNMRTLCLKCHLAVTAELRKRLQEARRTNGIAGQPGIN